MRKTILSTLLSSVVVSATLAVAGGAEAKITGFKMYSVKEIGPFSGKAYREVTGMLEGTAPGGAYSVPAVLAFPVQAADFNGFALVDVLNTTTVGNDKFPLGGRVSPVGRRQIGEQQLFGNGNIYVSALWDKKAAEFYKTGVIAQAGDGIEILRDAATLARNPALTKLHAQIGPAAGAKHVIAFGFSQTGGLLRGWYANHLNTVDGVQAFDGGIFSGAGGYCLDMAAGARNACEGPLSDGGKTIAINTEGDVERGGFLERGDTPDYRAIEIAGVSHLPAEYLDFRQLGLPDQNPVGFLPVVHAAFENMQLWLGGKEPPPSIYLSLKDGPVGSLLDKPYREAMRDKDGNALGGIRMPHLPGDSPGAGAPLGTYTGLALDKKDNTYLLIGGTFKPFGKEELMSRYPTREDYVKAVSAAANDLVAKRYFLQADAEAMIEAAKAAPIGQ